MNNTEIYYFSGTGNSLHVAQELQNRLPNSTILPMVSLIENDAVKTKGETVGFVFPTYFTTVPAPVRLFLKRVDMKSAKYTFSIVTRMGSFCVANGIIKRLLKKKGKRLDAQFILNMGNNSPTGLKPGKGDENWIQEISKEKISQLESKVQSHLDKIQKIIVNQKKYPEKINLNPLTSLAERIMYFLTRNIKTQINFVTDSTCTGCGICEKVCLSRKILMDNKKPHWQENVRCYYCYACFNFCPTQSILVDKKYTKKDGRYIHPDITADDIAQQKKSH
ncbi:MAG: EFR1 family ferrodoxin [Candidatus Thermoplasmatota archaeon]|nr:EFR1 family ferrodoxin [Candidatus Thermoplasmatota archaeon]